MTRNHGEALPVRRPEISVSTGSAQGPEISVFSEKRGQLLLSRFAPHRVIQFTTLRSLSPENDSESASGPQIDVCRVVVRPGGELRGAAHATPLLANPCIQRPSARPAREGKGAAQRLRESWCCKILAPHSVRLGEPFLREPQRDSTRFRLRTPFFSRGCATTPLAAE